MNILSFPDEIIVTILTLADNRLSVLQVCKRIYRLASKYIYPPWYDNGKKISHAVKLGWTDLFIILTDEAGPRWNPTMDNNAALRLACQNGRRAMLILMLRYQLNANAIGVYFNEKISPIEIAILNTQTDIVQMLLQYTKEKGYPVAWGYPPCNFLPMNHMSDECADILQMLLDDDRFTPVTEDGYSALCWAALGGKVNLTRILLADSRIDPTFGESLALYDAAKGGHADCVMLLLEDGRSDPSTRDNYVIKWASRKGYVSIVHKLLVDPRVDPSDGNNHAYEVAKEKKHNSIVEMLSLDSRVQRVMELNMLK